MPGLGEQAASVKVGDVDSRLPELLDRLDHGENVRLVGAGVSDRLLRRSRGSEKRTLGNWSGLIQVADDFDAPLAEFEEYS